MSAIDNTIITASDFIDGATGATATFAGDIEAGGNKDQYEFDAVAGNTYTFDAISSGTLGDNYLTLYDANGTLVTGNDDGGTGMDAQITWTPTVSGTYTVEAKAYYTSETGTYEMQIHVNDHESHINSDTIMFNSHVNNIPATGFNVTLVLDNSGSMSSDMSNMQQAVNNMLNIYEAVDLDTNIHVIYFDDAVLSNESQLFATNDFSGATAFINSIYALDATNYSAAADAAQTAIDALNSTYPTNTNHMYFISDGNPTAGGTNYEDFRSNISTLGIEVSMFALGFSGANTSSLDYFDNTNGSEVIATVDGLSQILLEELGTSQGSAFFSTETLLANDTNITNASVTNVSVTSAEGSLVDLGNGYFQYTPSDDEIYSNAANPTFTYTVNYDDISGNNITTTEDFVIQINLEQSINHGTDSDDTMLFSPTLYDIIDGGAGNDTLVAVEAFNNYIVGSSHDNVIMQDAGAYTSFITSMENFTFSDQGFTAAELAANNNVRPLFSTSESLVSGQWSNGFILPDLFSSGDAALDALYDYQFIGDSSGEILGASSANDFINSNAGDDAVNAGAGNDVIDGGLGSNFLTGGTGNDVFFSDGRGAANGDTTWSTITDFTSGSNMVNIWGYVDGVSSYAWYADQGAAGYTGATIHADIDGDGLIDTSMTFSGMDIADMSAPQALDIGGTGYLFVA